MPSPKEVRAAQNRQKERVAAQLVEKRKLQKRRRIIGSIVVAAGFIGLVAIVYMIGNNNDGAETVAIVPTSPPPTETTTTTVPMQSAKGKPCVALKDPLPKGSPPMLIAPGPAPTKLITQDLKAGTGAVVPKNAKVKVNYVGVSCSTGKIFDSSYSRSQPYDADLSSGGGLIVGWQQGIPGMKVGGVRMLAIPADQAYGAEGRPPEIAPDEALYFLVSAEKLN